MSLIEILQLGIIFVISIGLHEFAHAYVSHKLGDPTPKLQNRLTMNPLAHIDPIGFLAIFLVRFGWGKPVQINPSYYKNQTVGEFKVAIAGPITNLILATLGIAILLFSAKYSGININLLFSHHNIQELLPIANFLIQFSFINIILAIFNLTPLPPLDGFTIIKLINTNIAEKIMMYQRYIFIGFLILIFATPFGNIFSTIALKIFDFIITILGSIIY